MAAAKHFRVRAKCRELVRRQVPRRPLVVRRQSLSTGHILHMEAKLNVCGADIDEAMFAEREQRTVLVALRKQVKARCGPMCLLPSASVETRTHHRESGAKERANHAARRASARNGGASAEVRPRVRPRCSRGAAEVRPRGAAEGQPRCGRGTAEVQPRLGGDTGHFQ
eukprot:2792500-Prymnesium_polylepis.2